MRTRPPLNHGPLLAPEEFDAVASRAVILDTRVACRTDENGRRHYHSPRAEYLAGHLPGAQFACLINEFSDPDARWPFTFPVTGQVARHAGRLGITRTTPVVIYDDSNNIWAARLWWVLSQSGFSQVSVLDGGLKRWQASARPLQRGEPPPRTPQAEPALRRSPQTLDLDALQALRAAHPEIPLVNVLQPAVFRGAERPYQRPGHIPGSINLPYAALFNSGHQRLEEEAQLREQLAPLLADQKPCIVYCGGGITAAGTALVLAQLGKREVFIYDGSLNEWSADPALPLISE